MKRVVIASLAAFLALAAASAQTAKKKAPQQPQNPNRAVASDENATEARSGIKDDVDIIDGPRVERVSGNAAVVVWRTNKVAATRVVYGPTAGQLTQHAYVSGGSKDHRVELRNLRPGTTYYYAIESRYGRQRYDGQFSTP